MRSWIVGVTSPGGEGVSPTLLAFDAGMPQHNHGLMTKPQVTEALGDGRFRVEGVKFHMGGVWTLRVDVVAAAGADLAEFKVDVAP